MADAEAKSSQTGEPTQVLDLRPTQVDITL